MAADQPLSIDQMLQLFDTEPPEKAALQQVLTEIASDCQGRGFELRQVASGYRFQVRSDYGPWVSRLWEERPARYTRALLETLALIAYKQPITRGDIEEIRGVTVSTNIMRSLLEREWIRVVGHRDVPGRPAIYATTRTFLDYFDLSSLNDLPTLAAIKDLDKINEELDLSDEVVEARTIELTPGSGRPWRRRPKKPVLTRSLSGSTPFRKISKTCFASQVRQKTDWTLMRLMQPMRGRTPVVIQVLMTLAENYNDRRSANRKITEGACRHGTGQPPWS